MLQNCASRAKYCVLHGVQRRMISVDNFFVFLRLSFFYFVVAICDLVHDVETVFHLPYVLTASGIWKYFLKYE